MRRYSKRGEGPQQKMLSFRLDLDLVEHLNKEENKGRLINTLLRYYFDSNETIKKLMIIKGRN